MPSIAELEDKRIEVRAQIESLQAVRKDKGVWTPEELTTVQNLGSEYTEIGNSIEKEKASLEKQAKEAAKLDQLFNADKIGNNGANLTDGSGLTPEMINSIAQRFGDQLPDALKKKQDHRPTFRAGDPGNYAPLEADMISPGANTKNMPTNTLSHPAYRKAWQDTIRASGGHDIFLGRLNEVFAECFDSGCGTVLNPTDFASGGWMLNPMTFASELQKCCDKSVVMRSLARVLTVTSIGISIPRLTKRLASFALGCECEAPPVCDIPEGERIEFRPQPWVQCTGICDALLQFTTMNPEALLLDELARDLRENLENLYLYGNGQNAPLGIFHEAALSGPEANADQEIANGSFTGSTALNFLIDVMCSLPNCAISGAAWLFSNSAWCDILKLVDGNDRHYFASVIESQGVGTGTSRPSLMGHPVAISETITGDFSTDVGTDDLFSGAFGQWSSYLILDGPATDTKRDSNIYTNRTCWVVRGYTGGGPVNDCDFVRMKKIAAA